MSILSLNFLKSQFSLAKNERFLIPRRVKAFEIPVNEHLRDVDKKKRVPVNLLLAAYKMKAKNRIFLGGLQQNYPPMKLFNGNTSTLFPFLKMTRRCCYLIKLDSSPSQTRFLFLKLSDSWLQRSKRASWRYWTIFKRDVFLRFCFTLCLHFCLILLLACLFVFIFSG